ncbi:unnamed protein product [Clavelina lepadiformis]|uniref:Uncharacterized protein n=1 Tax=Clavelina lepadiformis TaxID=159417 RepID=A0ABP0GAQ1_CLALP
MGEHYVCGGDYNATDTRQNVTVKQEYQNGYRLDHCISSFWSSPGYAVVLNVSFGSQDQQESEYPYDWLEVN